MDDDDEVAETFTYRDAWDIDLDESDTDVDDDSFMDCEENSKTDCNIGPLTLRRTACFLICACC